MKKEVVLNEQAFSSRLNEMKFKLIFQINPQMSNRVNTQKRIKRSIKLG